MEGGGNELHEGGRSSSEETVSRGGHDERTTCGSQSAKPKTSNLDAS